MVSITRKRIKRQRHNRQVSERLAAYVLAAIGSVFFTYVAVVTMVSGSSSSKNEIATIARLRSSKDHPDLHVSDEQNAESFNAIALDILQTLDCLKLLNQTTTSVGASNSILYDEENANAAAQQRRLEAVDDLLQPVVKEDHVREINPLRDNNDKNNNNNQQNKEHQQYNQGNIESPDMAMDDMAARDWHSGDAYNYDVTPTAAHLFCMAALAGSHEDETDPFAIPTYWTSAIHCPVVEKTGSKKNNSQLQLSLLKLWSQARGDMTPGVLLKTLQLANEHVRALQDKYLNIWAPSGDEGLEYMTSVLNDPTKSADDGGIRGLGHNLGPGKLFVDVGSCLGLTSMAVQIMYPGTKIVSIEAASPNWLLQQINWKCNAAELVGASSTNANESETAASTAKDEPTIILAGVGPETGGMAKLMWRPQATTSTRSWTPASERKDSDVELLVKLLPWHSILTEAEIQHATIDVMNVDCQGCEYNLIPAMKPDEYNSIATVLGGVHWGYMPENKLPSSKRAATTHERLCMHENFARTVKECCAFPDLAVVSSVPGEVLVQDSKAWPPKASTVKDVAGSLCDDFDKWAEENHLYTIKSDFNWFRVSSMADL